MTTHIPTIQDLNRKTVPELRAMFRNASSIGANAQCSAAERAAARQMLDNVRRVLAARHPRP